MHFYFSKITSGLSEKQKLVFLTGFSFLLRLVWMFFTDNALKGDAEARLDKMYFWMQTKNSALFDVWPPMHFWLMQIFTYLFPHWMDAPRLLGVILGALLIIPLFFLVKNIFDSEIAWGTVLLYALGGIYIPISAVTMSEIPYFFFVISALFFMFAYLQKSQGRDYFFLLLSTIFFVLIRFEGWALALVLWLILLFQVKLNRWSLFYGTAVLFVCFLYSYFIWQSTGEWLYWLKTNDFLVARLNGFDPSRFSYLEKLRKISPAFYPSLLALSLYGIFYFIKKKKNLTYLFIIFSLLAPLLFKTLNHSLESFTRFYLLTGLLLAPLGFYGLKELCSSSTSNFTRFSAFSLIFSFEFYGSLHFGPNYVWAFLLLILYLVAVMIKKKRLPLAFVFLLILSSLLREGKTYGKSFHYDQSVVSSAEWGKNHFSPNDLLLLEEGAHLKHTKWLKVLNRRVDDTSTRYVLAYESISPQISSELLYEAQKGRAIYYTSFKENRDHVAYKKRRQELGLKFEVIYSDNEVDIYLLKYPDIR